MWLRSHPRHPIILVGIGLIALLLTWSLPSRPPSAAASLFQSPTTPSPVPSPQSTPATSEPSPPPAEGGSVDRAEPPRPLVVEPLQASPQNDLVALLRTLILALGYLWLACGVLILLAIPVLLIWLNRCGRRNGA